MKTDWLIVGAGFTGAVLAERIASQLNKKVVVIESRDHIGGNAFDRYDENGILIHRYGSHIFHTNSRRVWDYLSQFTEWRYYHHHVRAQVEGKLIPVPFNLNSLSSIFPAKMAERLECRLLETYGFGAKVPILRMLEQNDSEIKELGKFIYKNVFEGYTTKQWGLKPEELDSSVTGRVPVVVSRDDRYFQDSYQAMPRLGYTELFNRLLANKKISILLKCDYRDIVGEIQFERMVFTGAIDQYFGEIYGPLPYRSLEFEFVHEPADRFQECGVVNFPNDHLFTRIHDFPIITGQRTVGTTIAYEYPKPYIPGVNDPYYPIPREDNRELHSRYLSEAEKLRGTVLFAGRLADYKYYNMDQAVAHALQVFQNITQTL